MVNNPNYVKKVVFPLEVLGSSCRQRMLSCCYRRNDTDDFRADRFPSTANHVLWLPVIWMPLLMGSLACTWLLSAAGVFLRDIGQLIAVVLNMLMFLSPIFFPVSALPERWQPILNLNPIGQVIEQTRRVSVQGLNPEPEYVIVGSIISIIACEFAFRVFYRSKRAFADVL